MIERVLWPQPYSGESPSPFLRGQKERPLRITFHTSRLNDLPEEESEALQALLDMSNLPEIHPLQTSPGPFPSFEIGPVDFTADTIPVTITRDDDFRHTAIWDPSQWRGFAQSLSHEDSLTHPDVDSMFQDLLAAAAHHSLHQDILVTFSPNLLRHRAEAVVKEANPRSPMEAAEIVGLFLRSRGNYTYRAFKSGKAGFDRGLFYWVLTRHRLPALWRYFSACVYAEQVRKDGVLDLGQSVLTRSVRAIQARDEIGQQFYVPQGNNARDTIMYHFDYLTLLLAGALDAQARIAHRVYKIPKPKEQYTSFRAKEFLEALRSPANDFHSLVTSQYNTDLFSLIYLPRHTIHGAGLRALAYHEDTKPQVSFVSVPDKDAKIFWDATERCGSHEKWGLTKLGGRVLIEPYTYATTLVEEGLRLINAVALVTDVVRLFPENYPVPHLTEQPPEDDVFDEKIRKRLAVLG